jgi:hypothetical protein
VREARPAGTPDQLTRQPWTLEDKTMLRMTFDTLVAECADGAALIHAAWREGYDVVLLSIGQAAVEPQARRTGDEPIVSPSGPTTALAFSFDLCCVRDDGSYELTTEASSDPPFMTVEPGIIRFLGHLPRIPRKDWPQDPAMRFAVHIYEILRILSAGSDGLFSGSRSFTPVHQRWYRAAVCLAMHAYLRRDLFVSDQPDVSSRGERRQALSRLLKTRLMTTDECRSWLT